MEVFSNAEGNEILTILCNMIRSKRKFPKEWKIALIQPVYKGKGNQREPRKCRRILLLHLEENIYIQE
jgi:hypothetical protein